MCCSSCLHLQCTSLGIRPCRAHLCCPAAGRLSRRPQPICWDSALAKGGHKRASPVCVPSLAVAKRQATMGMQVRHAHTGGLYDLVVHRVGLVASTDKTFVSDADLYTC